MNVEIAVLNCHNGLKSLGLLIVIVIVILGHPYIGPQVHLGPIKIYTWQNCFPQTPSVVSLQISGLRFFIVSQVKFFLERAEEHKQAEAIVC